MLKLTEAETAGSEVCVGATTGGSVATVVSVEVEGLAEAIVVGAGTSVGFDADGPVGWLPHADRSPVIKIRMRIFVFIRLFS